jgi:predicted nucleic acid-binding protein
MSPSAGKAATARPPAQGTTYLVDTNVLLRLSQPTHPMHQSARTAVQALIERGHPLVTMPQCLWEFWAVATRPATAGGGLGMATEDAQTAVEYFEALYPTLPESPLHDEWKRLVITHRVSGKTTHDVRLVAGLKVHGLTHILTFNAADFQRFATNENIVVVDPASIK